MIRYSAEIYGKLLRGMFVLTIGGAIWMGPMEKMKMTAKRSLVKGLVEIPMVRK